MRRDAERALLAGSIEGMAAAAAAGGGGDGGVAPLVVRTAEELAAVSGLGDCATWITEEERGLASALLEAGQAHAFAGWTLGADVDAKHRFFAQVRAPESWFALRWSREGVVAAAGVGRGRERADGP